MVDDGVTVEGYAADITRTVVFGTPTQRQRDVWDVEKRGAGRGVRRPSRSARPASGRRRRAQGPSSTRGFGPGYKVPGLPHRTGHGIGLDGHEWTNFVKGNTTPIQVGMCF